MVLKQEYRVFLVIGIIFILLVIFRSTETFVDDGYGSEDDGYGSGGEVKGGIVPPATPVNNIGTNSVGSVGHPSGATTVDPLAVGESLTAQMDAVGQIKKEKAAAAASAALEKEDKKKQEKLKQDCENSVSQIWSKRLPWGRIHPKKKEQCLSACIQFNNKMNKCSNKDHLDDTDPICPFIDNYSIQKGDCHDKNEGCAIS